MNCKYRLAYRHTWGTCINNIPPMLSWICTCPWPLWGLKIGAGIRMQDTILEILRRSNRCDMREMTKSLSVAWSAFIVTSALSGLGWDRIQSLHWSSSEATISSPRHAWAFFPWQLLWRNTARHLNEQKQRRSPVCCWMSRMDFSTALWSQHTLPCRAGL